MKHRELISIIVGTVLFFQGVMGSIGHALIVRIIEHPTIMNDGQNILQLL